MLSLMRKAYHQPVMLKECMEGLRIVPNGVYVDLTFGGGGHSKAILEQLDEGRLFAFDQDPDAKQNATDLSDDPRFTFIDSNFRFVDRYLRFHNVLQVNGMLADLGVSSHQIDSPERGFSTRYNSLLDMRMSRDGNITAGVILNNYKTDQLQSLFSRYGEVRNAKTLASAIDNSRKKQELKTIDQFKQVLLPLAPAGKENKYMAQVFQAIRIEVNDELKALEEMLLAAPALLSTGGRLVVISYHSLEDRLVKNVTKFGNINGKPVKDIYGNLQRPFNPISKKPITPGDIELELNPRARSAKLRIAEKN